MRRNVKAYIKLKVKFYGQHHIMQKIPLNYKIEVIRIINRSNKIIQLNMKRNVP